MYVPSVPTVRVSITGLAMTTLDWATKYHCRGLCIVPMTLKGDKKKPAVPWKRYQRSMPSPQTLRRWFSDGKYEALAVVLGEVSGQLACRDFDDPDVYQQWGKNFPKLSRELPTVKTGRGYHVYFTCKLEKTQKFDDGELRGEKSLCVLPPSKHGNGKEYEWIVPLPEGPILTIDPEEAGLCPEPVLQKRTEAVRSKPKQSEADLSKPSAIGLVGKDEIELAISATLPKQPGQRNIQVFQLARAIRGISVLADAAPKKLKPIVRQWHSRALKHIKTKPFEETWFDFLYGWPRVEIPMRLNLLEDAMRLGKENCVLEPDYEQESLRDLVALCRGLQGIMGDKPFWLATRTAGRVLSVDHMTAWRWLFLLEQDGWIKTVTKGDQHKATRFRYLGGQEGQ